MWEQIIQSIGHRSLMCVLSMFHYHNFTRLACGRKVLCEQTGCISDEEKEIFLLYSNYEMKIQKCYRNNYILISCHVLTAFHEFNDTLNIMRTKFSIFKLIENFLHITHTKLFAWSLSRHK